MTENTPPHRSMTGKAVFLFVFTSSPSPEKSESISVDASQCRVTCLGRQPAISQAEEAGDS
ncbi:hypothetical protein AGRO_0881 [Agrobacterium sp. ATCC 31749]|nr:hypothetical protein AGRO_0881 [Agrobacterium sp. ATCC 31749]